MPRTSRKNINSSYIHVITQGIRKEYIFYKDEYKQYYINLLYKISQEYQNCNILAYCIMDNHAHILMYNEDVNELSTLMSRVNTSYGIFYNKVEKRVGYVFRNRYYTQEIRDEKHLFNSLVYIHRNPVKAQIVTKMEEYKYSSFNKYKNGTLNHNIIELIFHNQDYINQFNYIHKNFCEENIMDIKEEAEIRIEKMKKIIKEFCDKYKMSLELIKKDNYLLISLIKKLRKQCDVTNKEISCFIGIGKNRICNILKKDKSTKLE